MHGLHISRVYALPNLRIAKTKVSEKEAPVSQHNLIFKTLDIEFFVFICLRVEQLEELFWSSL